MSKIVKLWLPVLLWMILIFTFSSMQVGSTSEFYWKDFIFKKSAHIIEYGILAVLIYRALTNSGINRKKAFIYSVVIASLYGVSDEFHQSFTPGREPRFRDVAIDAVGATISLVIYEKINI